MIYGHFGYRILAKKREVCRKVEPLIIFMFIVSLIGLLYFVWLVARQKYKIILSEGELKESLKDIYRNVKGEVFVHAGEANFKTYSQLKPVIENFLNQDPENRVVFVLGPVISVSEDVFRKLRERKLDELAPEEIHPLFDLLLKHPDKVELYYKKDDFFRDINHFALGGKYLYMEAFHKPLEERKAILVENPTFPLKKKYEEYKNLLLNSREHVMRLSSDVKKLKKQIANGLVKFSDFLTA